MPNGHTSTRPAAQAVGLSKEGRPQANSASEEEGGFEEEGIKDNEAQGQGRRQEEGDPPDPPNKDAREADARSEAYNRDQEADRHQVNRRNQEEDSCQEEGRQCTEG